jgi:arylsulfatase A-like enzyme
MAAEGMRFTDFYAAASVCTPSRAALMTGSYPNRVSLPNVLSPRSQIGINSTEITIAELLKDRGYATACFGKWHLGDAQKFLPPHHGFDVYFGLPYSNDMSPNPRNNPAPNARKHPPLPLIRQLEAIETEPDQTQLTRRYTTEALKFIEANQDKPFFLYFPHTFPHVPLYASEEFAGKTPRGLFGDVVSEIDWSVGQILDKVKKLGLDGQTLIFFSSDNGPWLIKGDQGGSARSFREGKGTTFEGGHREVGIFRWPGKIPARKVCRELATTMDILPTFARLAGSHAPTDRVIDGKDIWPLLSGRRDARSSYEAFYYYLGRNLQAVRSGKWKLHVPHSYQSIKGARLATPTFAGEYAKAQIGAELFDLEKDAGEMRNVAGRHPEIVKRLESLLERAREDIGDGERKGKNVREPGRL